MKQYKSYMDRQEISPAVHENLLNLEALLTTKRSSDSTMSFSPGRGL